MPRPSCGMRESSHGGYGRRPGRSSRLLGCDLALREREQLGVQRGEPTGRERSAVGAQEVLQHELLARGVDEVVAARLLVRLQARNQLEPLVDRRDESAVVVGDLLAQLADERVLRGVGHQLSVAKPPTLARAMAIYNGSPELLIVMGSGATLEQTEHVVARLEEAGAQARVSEGREATVIGAIGERERLAALPIEGYPGVEQVLPILKPYKLVARELNPDPTVITISGRRIGDAYFGLVAGPCTVEYREQTLETARAVAAAGATMLRGGAFKPRTSPYTFQGLGLDALEVLREAREETGLPIVTELMDPRHVEEVVEAADAIQIGARNMQNFLLLAEVGRADKPVLLKRGPSASVEELLMAAEYVAKEGNDRIILCERGIKTFETSTRYTLDLGSVAVLKRETHLPVVVDPSHASGRADLVLPLARAAAAVGADGILVEVHPRPDEALCDGAQQLRSDEFSEFASEVGAIVALLGKQFG